MEKRYFEVEGIIKDGKKTYTRYFLPNTPCTDKICDLSHILGCGDTTCLHHSVNLNIASQILNDWKDAQEVNNG